MVGDRNQGGRVAQTVTPTDVEVFFDKDDLIVSKTDVKGRITYANRTFCETCGYSEAELLGAPHSIIRHPDMPRAVFKLLWDTLFEGREVFAYVKNMARSGAYYWVFAHVTPSFDRDKKIIGFHSNRRLPDPKIVKRAIEPVYAAVLQEERRHINGQVALAAGFKMVGDFLQSTNKSYDEFIFSL
jgi:PAS domain S-box-containing protein